MATPIPFQSADTSVNDQAQAEKDKAASLPGADKGDGNINWLGSSFSGVDIKVVAHLYGALEVDEAEAALQEELGTQEQIHAAAEQAKAGVPGNGVNFLIIGGADAFLRLAGLFPVDADNQKAASILAGAFGRASRQNGITGFESSLTRLLTNVSFNAKITSDNLRGQLQTRQKLRKQASSTITLATLQTMSLQTHREKNAVRALGNSYVKGYTRGPRTIAGSMVFTMFNEHALAKLVRAMAGKGSVYGERDADLSTLIIDQLPPIDITVAIANEYGQLSQLGIYGLEFVNDGMTMSVEDILTEEVCQFVARDCDVLTAMGSVKLSQLQRGMHFNNEGGQDTSGTSLLFSSQEAYSEYLKKLKVRRRLNNR